MCGRVLAWVIRFATGTPKVTTHSRKQGHVSPCFALRSSV